MEITFLTISSILLYIILFIFIIFLAFLPTFVALYTKHVDTLWIFIINFGLGGTGLFWILALIWAIKTDWQIKKLLNQELPK